MCCMTEHAHARRLPLWATLSVTVLAAFGLLFVMAPASAQEDVEDPEVTAITEFGDAGEAPSGIGLFLRRVAWTLQDFVTFDELKQQENDIDRSAMLSEWAAASDDPELQEMLLSVEARIVERTAAREADVLENGDPERVAAYLERVAALEVHRGNNYDRVEERMAQLAETNPELLEKFQERRLEEDGKSVERFERLQESAPEELRDNFRQVRDRVAEASENREQFATQLRDAATPEERQALVGQHRENLGEKREETDALRDRVAGDREAAAADREVRQEDRAAAQVERQEDRAAVQDIRQDGRATTQELRDAAQAETDALRDAREAGEVVTRDQLQDVRQDTAQQAQDARQDARESARDVRQN